MRNKMKRSVFDFPPIMDDLDPGKYYFWLGEDAEVYVREGDNVFSLNEEEDEECDGSPTE